MPFPQAQQRSIPFCSDYVIHEQREAQYEVSPDTELTLREQYYVS